MFSLLHYFDVFPASDVKCIFIFVSVFLQLVLSPKVFLLADSWQQRPEGHAFASMKTNDTKSNIFTYCLI